MAHVRISTEAIPAGEQEVPLPEYWEELDNDEQNNWLGEQIGAFASRFRIAVEFVGVDAPE